MKLLIENGLVMDPQNRVESPLQVLLVDGKVAALTREAPAGDFQRLDARGRVVCPGFLDIHMHEPNPRDFQDLEHSIFGCMVRMGVTTALGGNCGDNLLPPGAYFQLVEEAQGIPTNLALLAGHGAARDALGIHDRYVTLTEAQIQQVCQVLRQWLAEGCYGISYGIRYYPGMDRRELMATAQLAAGTDLLVSAHVRDDAAFVVPSLEEFLEAGRAYDLKLQVSHLGSMAAYGQMTQALAQLDEARLQGLDVMADCYPYSAFSTQIGETTYDPGFLERYQCDYDAIIISDGPHTGEHCTKALFEQLRRESPDTLTVAHVMKPQEVTEALCHPAVMLGSDGLMHGNMGHPRAAGSFPRLLREYVGPGKLRLYEAIEKMTSLPAQRIGLPQKGNLAPGSDGDVVIFDPETIRDTATFQDPDRTPEGIDYVLLRGEIACDHGTLVRGNLGKALRRT